LGNYNRLMDLKALDKALQEIALKRNALSKLDYNNPEYDDLEESLHDAEDAFQDSYGDYMEEGLQEVHDEWCPDTDILYPIAYIAKTFSINDKKEFSVAGTEGVYVEVDKLPNLDTKLVLVPNPTRVILNIGKDKQQVVWTAK
jgi:hypothetical protein